MNKVVALLALTALIAGCKTNSAYTQVADFPALRCFAYWDDKAITSLEVSYIRDLSQSGNLPCTIMLGDLYEKGRGVPQDISKAKALYQAVADKDASAYGQLGRMAEEGIGGPVNDTDARQFYQLAVSKPEQQRSEAKLAKYMEDGRGGPQDLQGALTHYFNATQYLGDDAWQGIERLRAKGLPLTIEQQQRYNNLFVSSVQSGLKKRITAIEKSLENNVNPTSASKPVQVQLEYTPGASAPVVSIRQSSGDTALDQRVMQGFSDYRFPGDPIMPPGQKSYQAIPIVRTDGKSPMQRFNESRKTEPSPE
ncbi:sel1 repeat family protein [Pseudomonas sp. MWU12-2115]|uniref:tetratricopeptide repeat protein n=1 Tax=unclassified Pseudomonas TaxID=196821 RepID=UPI000CD5A800|nr:SEL1-like repeat protein [Pseudomonas sp. MWU12-2020]RBC01604.1 sel1 repeat family protein [Pseudomonas sp. MWU12-2115]